ncbi:MAG: hypothetical protein E6R03_05265 [Hyphomicrobiaceae bacterium]|nr:MAG: hypothetical protein E6R03_05265 [Hyphomicrobiaceae bacterium]
MIHFSELELRPGKQAENGARKIVSIGKRTKVNVTRATVSALRPDLVSLFCAAPRLYNALRELLNQTVRQDEKYGVPLSEGEQEAYAEALAAISLADFIPADTPAPRRVQWVVTELADGEITSTRIYDHEETALDAAVVSAQENLPDAEELGTELLAKLLRENPSLSTTTGSYEVWLQEVEVFP